AADSAKDIWDYYKKHQILHIRGCGVPSVRGDEFGVKQIKRLHDSAREMIRKTFCVETASKNDLGWCSHSSDDILGTDGPPSGSWYMSFIAQGDKELVESEKGAVEEFQRSLPLQELSSAIASAADLDMETTSPVWVFIGRNSEQMDVLVGRPEHTDDVSHDGTWHFQAKGSKVWFLRPAESPEWGHSPVVVGGSGKGVESSFSDALPRLKVVVNEGDVFMLNTRIWWHQTRIPYTSKRGLSISYARDYYCSKLRLPNSVVDHTAGGTSYDNVDGCYASRTVEAGEVVLTEAELPDCALPRSEEPNCEIAWLEDGTGALVALTKLNVGDWLSVAPSDDEDDSDDEEEEEC
ncbi:unnamed protein product, partial [Ectocarpus fasciculatus]